VDDDIINEPSVVVVADVVVVIVRESGEEGTKMRILTFFDLVKIA
jgi:hypothetical protein